MAPQDIRKENFNKPDVASDELINDLYELQSLSWKIDDLEMPGKNEMDPYTGEVAKEYINNMSTFKAKAEEINEKAVSEIENRSNSCVLF